MAEGFTTPVKNKQDVLNIPPSPFLKRLGYGTGVTVYELTRSPNRNHVRSPWAIKMINSKEKNTVFGQRLREEADLLRKMNHPNIVGFRAFAKTNLGTECLAMETCTTALSDLIEQRAEDIQLAFPVDKMMRVGQHIAKALDYLHVRMLLLHGDIKSHNILIVGDFKVCKLCDFGVSLPLNKNGELDTEKAGENAEYVGTSCWSAPEVLQDSVITTKADIFSFGLVLWEMIALDIPHFLNETLEEPDDLEMSLENSFRDNSHLFGTRPAIPYHMLGKNIEEYNHPLEIFYCCTEKNPADRPTAHHLGVSIYEMINEKSE